MKKNLYNFTILSFLILCLFFILSNPKEIIEAGIFSLEIWKKNIFPSLFPFFILADLLINYGFVGILGNLLKKPAQSLFHLRSVCAFVIIMSLLSGFPSSAKYITKLYHEKIITLKEANHLITFTHFSNPLFILGTIFSLLNNQKICLCILFAHYGANFILGILLREKKQETTQSKFEQTKKPFVACFSNSIENTIHTLAYILGTITVFLVLTTVLFKYIDLPILLKNILRGFLEITQGIKYISAMDLSIHLKGLIITIFLSFGGLCIHMQVLGIIKDIKIKYSRYFFSRILHAILASSLYLFFLIFLTRG